MLEDSLYKRIKSLYMLMEDTTNDVNQALATIRNNYIAKIKSEIQKSPEEVKSIKDNFNTQIEKEQQKLITSFGLVKTGNKWEDNQKSPLLPKLAQLIVQYGIDTVSPLIDIASRKEIPIEKINNIKQKRTLKEIQTILNSLPETQIVNRGSNELENIKSLVGDIENKELVTQKIQQWIRNGDTLESIKSHLEEVKGYLSNPEYLEVFRRSESYLKFIGDIHSLESSKKISSGESILASESHFQQIENLKVYSDENFNVYTSTSMEDFIKLGCLVTKNNHYELCISTKGGGNLFYTYRFEREQTTYFVYFKNEEAKNEKVLSPFILIDVDNNDSSPRTYNLVHPKVGKINDDIGMASFDEITSIIPLLSPLVKKGVFKGIPLGDEEKKDKRIAERKELIEIMNLDIDERRKKKLYVLRMIVESDFLEYELENVRQVNISVFNELLVIAVEGYKLFNDSFTQKYIYTDSKLTNRYEHAISLDNIKSYLYSKSLLPINNEGKYNKNLEKFDDIILKDTRLSYNYAFELLYYNDNNIYDDRLEKFEQKFISDTSISNFSDLIRSDTSTDIDLITYTRELLKKNSNGKYDKNLQKFEEVFIRDKNKSLDYTILLLKNNRTGRYNEKINKFEEQFIGKYDEKSKKFEYNKGNSYNLFPYVKQLIEVNEENKYADKIKAIGDIIINYEDPLLEYSKFLWKLSEDDSKYDEILTKLEEEIIKNPQTSYGYCSNVLYHYSKEKLDRFEQSFINDPMLSYQYAIDLLQRDDFERARKFEPTIAKDEETDNPFYYIRALQILRQPIPRIIYNSLSDLQKSRLGRDVKIREDNIAERRINKIYKLFLRS